VKLIHGGRVLRPDTFECTPADIVVEGDTIRDIVAPGTVKDANAERVDAGDRALIPGLVNGHNHAQTGLAKGIFDRYTLELYLNAVPWATGRRTLEDKYLSAVIGAAEMVRKGCTAAYDMFAEFPLPTIDGVNAVAKAYADVGMRASVATMMADKSFHEAIPGLLDAIPASVRELATRVKYAPHEHAIAACRDLAKGWSFDRDQVRLALGPTIPHHCTDAFLTASRDLASEFGLGMQMHVAESKMQAVVAHKVYGRTLVAHLDALGMLGPHFCVSHGVWLEGDDMQRLVDRGASLSHNPGSNLKLGSGIADFRRMLDRGINVAIGTDGTASSDNLNVFEAMRLAAYLTRVQDHPTDRWVSAREAFRAATEGGARALGFDRIGRLAPGYNADVVFIDLGALHYVPMNDFIQQLVFGEDGTGVDSVMVGGRMVMSHGKLLTVDVARVRLEAEEAVARLAAANAEAKVACDTLAPFVGQFCSGLAATPLSVHRFCGHAH
jgi:5-methylthioadenosine/S-adenosylhomocysteine deaminase